MNEKFNILSLPNFRNSIFNLHLKIQQLTGLKLIETNYFLFKNGKVQLLLMRNISSR